MLAQSLPSPAKQRERENVYALDETPNRHHNNHTYNNEEKSLRLPRLEALSSKVRRSPRSYGLPSCYSSSLSPAESARSSSRGTEDGSFNASPSCRYLYLSHGNNKSNNNNKRERMRPSIFTPAVEFASELSPAPQNLSPIKSENLIDFSAFVTDYNGEDRSDNKVFSVSTMPDGLIPTSKKTSDHTKDSFQLASLKPSLSDGNNSSNNRKESPLPVWESVTSPSKRVSHLISVRRPSKSTADVQRLHFFQVMKEAVELLQARREAQDLLPADDFSQSTLSKVSTASRQLQKEFYYDRLDTEETDIMDRLTSEMDEVKARRRPKYDDTTVQGCWAALIRSEQLEPLGKLWVEEMIKKEVCMPAMWAKSTQEELLQSFLSIMDECVYLYDKPKEMFEVLPAAGTAHRRFGIGEGEMYIFRNAFITALERSLSSEAYRRSAADWNRFWKMAMDLMVQGSKSGEGEENAKLHQHESVQQLQTMLRQIQEQQDRSPDLEDHFIRVMLRRAGDSGAAFLSVFHNRRACDRIYHSFQTVAAHLLQPEENAAYMRELGARHVAYKIDRPVLEAFEEPFITTSAQFLGDAFDVVARHNFTNFYRLMVDGISAGMDSGKNTGENKKAPDGSEPFCLLFTDIESSTNLWQRFPAVMKEAVERHHRIIRTVIADNGGYEVKTVGDSFIIAAKDVFVGMKIAVGIQLELMRHLPIAPGFKALGNEVGGGDPNAWSNQTLRVRIGIEHCTQATATYDTIHRRYDYYGPSVNQCARIEAAAAGGQILMSRDTFKALKAVPAFHDEPCPAHLRDVSGNGSVDEKGLDHFVAVGDVGKAKLKGIKKEVRLLSLAPLCFAGRDFSNALPIM
ncbi:Adenylate and Guanylate cyclase catalytic domain containing protein, putative [Angomonas deanei]|uniref:Adenylate and Guanylate cyclase catalytic domain containing protein, putative n=1 Tax=Angomonas deanei TaxID=59799 RepID=A0A7G2CT14_9TRYP|nr:Adenylate and Guanylate cyclase catalytic domain containing protein, putative [Angomonas deanei]